MSIGDIWTRNSSSRRGGKRIYGRGTPQVDLHYSPVREPRDFPTPPRIYNPWDDYVPQENPFDDVELDYGGQEMSGQAHDEEEEEGDDDEETESDGDGDGDGDDDDE